MAINSIKNVHSLGQKQRVKIFAVDPSSRTIHATLMREGAGIQIAVWETGTVFRWPQVDEIWTVYKGTNGIWMLDKPVETADTLFSVEEMNPGDARIDSDVVKTASGGDVVITDQSIAVDGGTLIWQAASATWVPQDSPQVPQVRVFNSAALPIANNVDTALTFDSERWDFISVDFNVQHSTSTNSSQLICQVDGLYSIGGSVEFASNATGYRELYVRLNGVDSLVMDIRAPVSGQVTRVAVQTDYRLAVDDFVELVVKQTSGASLNVDAVGKFSPEFWFSWRSL